MSSTQHRDDRKPLRLAWAKLNAYGVLLAGLAVLGAADLIDPGHTDLARLVGGVPPGQPYWTSAYVVSGVLLIYGFIREDRLAETLALAILTLALAAQMVVAFCLLGFTDYTFTRVAVLALVSFCAIGRVSALWSRDGLTITIPARKPK